MGNYYENVRYSPHIPFRVYRGGVPYITGSFSARKETCLSYRTSSSGKLIPEHIADPYAYFLRNAAIRKREKAVLEYGDPGEGSIVGIDVSPFKREADTKIPIVDNGHAFKKVDFSIATDRSYGNYHDPYFNRSSDQLWAEGAQVALLHRGRMPFQFAGTVADSKARFSHEPSSNSVNFAHYGHKAIADTSPTRPDVSLSAIIGELREGLPSIPGILLLKDRTSSLRKNVVQKGNRVGREYLNIQFGLLPLISDIKDVISALEKATDRLAQYERDAGKGVRRRMSFPTKKITETFASNELSNQGSIRVMPTSDALRQSGPNTTSDALGFGWSSSLTMRYTERVWFSGSFTYFVPSGTKLFDNVGKYQHMVSRLYGTDITVETLWQLSPWSWLVDWLFDLNASISSYQRIQDDSLVVNYGYLMATTSKVAVQDTIVTSYSKSQKPSVLTCRSTSRTITKERVRSNPYGFSATTPDMLNGRQWSILAALGLSRM